ncbi:hypothetical protein [Citrobacter portucalensis]|uniref:hypothetical protein n=1 Tax=Citrobacter portucalensis TaxID=1639133 RepID=UPI004042F39C
MDSIIISGVRIYFPPDNNLPDPSGDMRTFAVVNYNLPGYVLLEFRNNGWIPALERIFADAAHAISAVSKPGKADWK